MGRVLWIAIWEWRWVDVFCNGVAVVVWEVFRDSVVCDWVWVSCFRSGDEAFGDAKFDDSEGGRRGGGGEEEGEGRRRIDGGFEENELVAVAVAGVVFNVLMYTYLFIIVLKTNFDFKKLFLFEKRAFG